MVCAVRYCLFHRGLSHRYYVANTLGAVVIRHVAALSLWLMVTICVGSIEWAGHCWSADRPFFTNAEFVTNFRAAARFPKNVIVFKPTPNIDMFVGMFGAGSIGKRESSDFKERDLAGANVALFGYSWRCLVMIIEIWLDKPIKNTEARACMTAPRGRYATIFPSDSKVIANNLFVRASMRFLPCDLCTTNDIGAELPLSGIACNCNSFFRSSGGLFGLGNGIARSPQRLFKKENRPDAYQNSRHARNGHNPLRERVAPNIKRLAGLEWFIRLCVFFGLGAVIMVFAARFSGRDWGQSAWRFYGGLVGGLALCGVTGVLILGWPFLRMAGVLP